MELRKKRKWIIIFFLHKYLSCIKRVFSFLIVFIFFLSHHRNTYWYHKTNFIIKVSFPFLFKFHFYFKNTFPDAMTLIKYGCVTWLSPLIKENLKTTKVGLSGKQIFHSLNLISHMQSGYQFNNKIFHFRQKIVRVQKIDIITYFFAIKSPVVLLLEMWFNLI